MTPEDQVAAEKMMQEGVDRVLEAAGISAKAADPFMPPLPEGGVDGTTTAILCQAIAFHVSKIQPPPGPAVAHAYALNCAQSIFDFARLYIQRARR